MRTLKILSLTRKIATISISGLWRRPFGYCTFRPSSSQSMAQTIELAQVRRRPYDNLCSIVLHTFVDGEKRSSQNIGKKIPRSLAIRKALRSKCTSCCRHLGSISCWDHGQVSKMVWKLPLPLHEWQFASGTCVHYLQDRICCRLSAYVRQTSSLSTWLSRYWDAHKGAQTLTMSTLTLYTHTHSLIRPQQTRLFAK